MRTSFLCGGLLLSALLLVRLRSQAQVPLRHPRPSAATGSTTPSASRPADYPLAPAPQYAAIGRPGTYRLPDGSWHSAEIFGPDMSDRVRLRPENLAAYALFWPGEASAYVVRGDTFVTVPAFVQHQRHRLVPAGFAQRLYHDDRYEVFLYQAPTPETQRSYNTPAEPNGPAVPTPGAAAPLPSLASPTAAFDNSFLGLMLGWFVYPRTHQKVLLRQGGQLRELPAKASAYRALMLGLLADDPALGARLRAGELGSRFEAPQLLAAHAEHRREAKLQSRK